MAMIVKMSSQSIFCTKNLAYDFFLILDRNYDRKEQIYLINKINLEDEIISQAPDKIPILNTGGITICW